MRYNAFLVLAQRSFVNKRGVATLISLMFVVLAILFSTVFFGFLNSSLDGQKQEYALVQKNLLYLDSLAMLKNSKQILGNSFSPAEYIARFDGLAIASKDTNITIRLGSAHSKINFNNYREANQTNAEFDKFLKNLLVRYNVADANYLLKLIENSKSDDTNASKPVEKISLHDIDYKNGYFCGYEHFTKLLNFYQKTTKDLAARSVPWQELFIFAPRGVGDFIDCETVAPALSLELLRQYQINASECKEVEPKYFKIKGGSSKESYYILVDIAFDINGAKERIKYYYDLKSERVHIIE